MLGRGLDLDLADRRRQPERVVVVRILGDGAAIGEAVRRDRLVPADACQPVEDARLVCHRPSSRPRAVRPRIMPESIVLCRPSVLRVPRRSRRSFDASSIGVTARILVCQSEALQLLVNGSHHARSDDHVGSHRSPPRLRTRGRVPRGGRRPCRPVGARDRACAGRPATLCSSVRRRVVWRRISARLGAASEAVEYVADDVRYGHPNVSMRILHDFVRDRMRGGSGAAWSIGAIPYDGDETRNADWVRYEQAVNDVLQHLPLRGRGLHVRRRRRLLRNCSTKPDARTPNSDRHRSDRYPARQRRLGTVSPIVVPVTEPLLPTARALVPVGAPHRCRGLP